MPPFSPSNRLVILGAGASVGASFRRAGDRAAAAQRGLLHTAPAHVGEARGHRAAGRCGRRRAVRRELRAHAGGLLHAARVHDCRDSLHAEGGEHADPRRPRQERERTSWPRLQQCWRHRQTNRSKPADALIIGSWSSTWGRATRSSASTTTASSTGRCATRVMANGLRDGVTASRHRAGSTISGSHYWSPGAAAKNVAEKIRLPAQTSWLAELEQLRLPAKGRSC